VESPHAKLRYFQQINKKFIKEREELDCFLDPASLYETLVENFPSVKIEKGALSYMHVWGKIIKNKKMVTIEIIEQERD